MEPRQAGRPSLSTIFVFRMSNSSFHCRYVRFFTYNFSKLYLPPGVVRHVLMFWHHLIRWPPTVPPPRKHYGPDIRILFIHLNHYFDRHVCPSIRPSFRSFIRHKIFFRLNRLGIIPWLLGSTPGLTMGSPRARSPSGGARMCLRSGHFLVNEMFA